MAKCHDVLQAFYKECLLAVPQAVEYINSRFGDKAEDIVRIAEFGYCPNNSVSIKRLKDSGYYAQAKQLGLLTGRGDDLNKGRLTFPIRDADGNIKAFYGRTLDPEEDIKYVNSVFEKGEFLFGSHLYDPSTKSDTVIVEGPLDALMNVPLDAHVMSPMGTNVSEKHIDLLARLNTEMYYIAFDGDRAGRSATIKLASRLVARGLKVKCLWLPDGADPGESWCALKKYMAEETRVLSVRDFSMRVAILKYPRSYQGALPFMARYHQRITSGDMDMISKYFKMSLVQGTKLLDSLVEVANKIK